MDLNGVGAVWICCWGIGVLALGWDMGMGLFLGWGGWELVFNGKITYNLNIFRWEFGDGEEEYHHE